MSDDFTEAQASVLIGTAEKMIDIWNRLSPEKQAALLARFGSEENALAALVTTQLVAPRKILTHPVRQLVLLFHAPRPSTPLS